MFCNTYLDTILSSDTGLEMLVIFLLILVLIFFCYSSKKYWASLVLIFALAAIIKAYLLRSDILDHLFGKYIKQEPRYVLRIIEILGTETVAFTTSYYLMIKRLALTRKNLLAVLISLSILSFGLGTIIFFTVACP